MMDIQQNPVGWYFMDDPEVVAMPGSGYSHGKEPPNDAINLIPLFAQPDQEIVCLKTRIAELESENQLLRSTAAYEADVAESYKAEADTLRSRVTALETYHELNKKQIAYLFEERNDDISKLSTLKQQVTELRKFKDACEKQNELQELGDGVFHCQRCGIVDAKDHCRSNGTWCDYDAKWIQGPFYTHPYPDTAIRGE